ncbi:MAG: hypothetical protein GY899_13615 [Verrucomicrobiaceae bacterium]|nr:hypothetical protein [Verrucomicrobiaceae bacterium]
MTIFQNTNVRVVLNEGDKPYLSWYDLKDKYNDFQGFTRNTRGLPAVVSFIKHLATTETLRNELTMSNFTALMTKHNLNPHTFCGMD